MSDGTLSDGAESITPAELKERITTREEVFILDTRAETDFEEWHIQHSNVTIVNYPYFQLLDDIPADLLAALPETQPITVICAKGEASDFVAEKLQEAGYNVDHLARGMEGWAGIYEPTELDVDLDATIIQYQRPSSGCLAYLVVSGDEAAVIDPLRAFTDAYVEDANALGATITYVLDTHIHADHVSGLRTLANQTNATRILPEPAADRGVDYDIEYETIADGDTLIIGNIELDVLHTPGHTTGMTAYEVGGVLFTGDGLFTESVARPDLEDPEEAKIAARTLYHGLTETVLPLPNDTTIAPAHFGNAATPNDDGTYTALLGDLQRSMDALSMDKASFVEFIVSDLPPRPANYEEIIATNLGQKTIDDEDAFHLELGPNNCAASEEALTN